MKKLPFKPSTPCTLGVELELQLIDPVTYDLIARAKDLIRNIREGSYRKLIKPEITQSMIEFNSSIHQSPVELHENLLEMRSYILDLADKIGIKICGGGTHPFQKWTSRKIFPTKRYKNLSQQFKYLSKRSTVFGQHIHIGCDSGENAIYLTHALARYVPHFIALSASSPFYQGIDTGFHSCRSNVFTAFPSSGVIPFLKDWEDFSDYFYKMRDLGIAETMKDFYWDIRPKPEFGTVEIRVCDTPLTILKATSLAAYAQSIVRYLLVEKPQIKFRDLYFIYNYNRFQACRYGFEGDFINPNTLEHSSIADNIMQTIKHIEKHANDLNNMPFISQLIQEVINKNDNATLLRKIYHETGSFQKLVREQCIFWETK